MQEKNGEMSVDELKDTGNKCFQHKNYQEALQWYEKALALAPSSAALYSNISAAYFHLKQYNDAVKAAEKCIELEPSWEKGYYRKGKALFELGDFMESYAAYEKGAAVSKSSKVMTDARSEALAAYHKFSKTDYYDHITKDMDVEVTFFGGAKGKGLTSKKYFKTGEILFTELPLVSHISVTEDTTKFHFICSHCMRTVLKEETMPPEWRHCYPIIYENGVPEPVECKGKCGEKYCSTECQKTAWQRYHKVMCTSRHPHISVPLQRLFDSCKKHQRTNPLVIARMFATVATRMKHGKNRENSLKPFLVFVGGEWASVSDEECFQFLREIFKLEEHEKLGEVLNLAMYRNMNGMIQRNTSKIHPVSDFHTYIDNEVYKLPMSEDKVNLGGKIVEIKHLQEILGDEKVVNMCISGTGLYTIANCANHDCKPNVMVVSSTNSNKLSLISRTNIQKGEEVTISYIDEENFTFQERQKQLQDKYWFTCECSTCNAKK